LEAAVTEGTPLGRRSVEIELNGLGHGKVLLDGRDIARLVRSVRFSSEVGEATRVILEIPAPDIRARFEGADVVFIEEQLDSPVVEFADLDDDLDIEEGEPDE
jgi:hypothetical protein